MNLTLAERFYRHVNKNGPTHPVLKTRCWLWTAYIRPDGYGSFNVGRQEYAHRVAWLIEHGKYPEPCGLHKCDNRACVRTSHMFEGTDLDNSRDKQKKGRCRIPRGEANIQAKLTEANVLEIRKRKLSKRKLAQKFGVSRSLISDIVSRRRWKHL